MRVCLDLTTLLTSSRFGGIGSYCRGLVRGLAAAAGLRRELDLDVRLLMGPPGRLRLVPVEEGAARLDAASWGTRTLGDAAYLLLKHTEAAARLAAARLDLYHSPEPPGTQHPPRCRVVVTCHDLIPIVLGYPYQTRVLPRGLRLPLERLRFRRVDHVLCISRCTAADLRRLAGVPEERLSLVYPGVDLERFQPRAEPGERRRVSEALGTDRPYLFYLGGFDRRRQVPQTVEAFARTIDSVDEVLVVGGRMSPRTRQTIQGILDRHGARERVLLPGFLPLELLPALYRQATAHVMLSRYEGFGMTAVEALACGCPVLAQRASCAPEVLGEAALLIPGLQDAPAAMVRISRDEALRADLRERGPKRAARYTWAACAEGTLRAYGRVGGRK